MIFAQFEGPTDPEPPEELGSPASPIDMYIYVLVFIAFLLIVYSKKIKQKTILYTNAGRSSNPKILEAIFKTFLKEEIEDEGKEINK